MHSLFFRHCTAAAVTSLMACQVADPHDDYYEEGLPSARADVRGGEAELTVEWTIAGTADPRACFDFAVDHAYITIEDDYGLVDEADVDCEAFGYDAPSLPPGTYWASVVLRDASGYDLTDVAESDGRDLPPGTSDYLAVDFSESQFR